MITVRDLAKKLHTYASIPGNADIEVMLSYDGDIALPFERGDDHQAMGPKGVERFLVFVPDQRGKKLKTKTPL